MPRILLLLPTATYRAPDFLSAAARLGVEVVVGSERRQAMAPAMGERALLVPLDSPDQAVDAIVSLHARAPFEAVLAADDQGIVIAARAAERLGFRHNAPDAVAATRDKAEMRRRLAAASVSQPDFRVADAGVEVEALAAEIGFPCVLKPVSRSASQGVIRADDVAGAKVAAERIRAIEGVDDEPLLVERFVSGEEVAVEGLLDGGRLDVLAVFDKPDPLNGPYFEESIYVTPSRHPPPVLARIRSLTAQAAAALGLSEGPVHAEARVGVDGQVTMLELAARSIGGLCARSLRFGTGASLEEIIIRHAVGRGVGDLIREEQAAGVMMIPIRSAGVLGKVLGREHALAIDGIVGVEIGIAAGRQVVPVPEGDRYLGFIFARGATPEQVEDSLRRADACLTVELRPPHHRPVVSPAGGAGSNH